MANAKGEWIIPFLNDLKGFAAEHDMGDLARDLADLIERHGPVIAPADRRLHGPSVSADVVELGVTAGTRRKMPRIH